MAYARVMTEVIQALNCEFCQRIDPAQLAAADAVLRAVFAGDSALQQTAAAIRPPAGHEGAMPD